MKIDLSQFRQTFVLESAEHIASMEEHLLGLRSAPGDMELLNSIFRSAHSIKGGAGSFGMGHLAHFAHVLENLLERLRSAEMQATEESIALLLRSVDVLRGLLEADADAPMPAAAETLEKQLEALTTGDAEMVEAALASVPLAAGEREEALYRIAFRPCREIFLSGTNPIVLLRNLAMLGKVVSCQLHTDEVPALVDLDPGLCYLNWTMELASSSPEAEVREVFEFVEDQAEIHIERVEAVAAAPPLPSVAAESAPPMAVAAPAQRRAAEKAPAPVQAAPARKQSAKQAAKKPAASGEAGSIRVPIDKVDKLIDLVGELVIAHVMTAQMVMDFDPSCLPRLRDAVAAMERSTRELHERVMGVRMLPIGTLFSRHARTVYDIAQATGKQIRLETEGEETEIDKSMLELLTDPLTHLVRNAADHGIERPEVRLAAGKPVEGVITLRAFHRAGRVVIEGTDDGAGVDLEKVRAKAIARGLIAADAQLSDEQTMMLIFEPGFSTQEAVSDRSGRGVGMDVVKSNVEKMHGTVHFSSEMGKGSTIVIELPLTLAILEGLLVRVADRTLVVPLLSVSETVPLPASEIRRVSSTGEVVVIREESIPLLRLSRFLGLPPASGAAEERQLAVIVQAGPKKIGLVVDELLGQQQVVGKSLKKHFREVAGLMGATILGDGCVAPIVDVTGIAALDLYGLQGAGKTSSRSGAQSRPAAGA
jgi:two-component system chemotaxis sensor kinase CheA